MEPEELSEDELKELNLRYDEEKLMEHIECGGDYHVDLSVVPKKMLRSKIRSITRGYGNYDYAVLYKHKTDEKDHGIFLRKGYWDSELIIELSDRGKYKFKVIAIRKRYPWEIH